MKKLLLTSAMAMLFFVGLTSMVNAPQQAYDCQSDCAFLVGIGVFPTQGTCMSACRTCTNNGQGIGVVANCICKIAGPFYGDPLLGQANHGACVNLVKSVLGN